MYLRLAHIEMALAAKEDEPVEQLEQQTPGEAGVPAIAERANET
jgi:hypothetical protein